VQPAAAGESAETTSGETPVVSEEETALSEPQPKPNRPFVSRLIRENERLKQEQAAKDAQIAYLTRQLTPSQQTPPQRPVEPTPAPVSPLDRGPGQASDRPRPEAFPTHEAWVEALTDWKYEQREQHARQQHEVQTAQQQWEAREQEGRQKYPDYDEAVQALEIAPQVGGVVADTFRESDQGADVLYYLANHPDETLRLNRMTPVAAARWLGQLESRLAHPPAKASAQPKPTTTAPAAPAPAPPGPPVPMQPVGGASSVPTAQGVRPGMSLADYERMRAAQRAGQR
jgi:hypothetical protein